MPDIHVHVLGKKLKRIYFLMKVEVARMSTDGVVSWGDDLSRASGGSMEKVAEGRYTLKLFSARPLDTGSYRCVVSVYAGRRNPGPSVAATLTQKSEGVVVNLKTKGESGYPITAEGRVPADELSNILFIMHNLIIFLIDIFHFIYFKITSSKTVVFLTTSYLKV